LPAVGVARGQTSWRFSVARTSDPTDWLARIAELGTKGRLGRLDGLDALVAVGDGITVANPQFRQIATVRGSATVLLEHLHHTVVNFLS